MNGLTQQETVRLENVEIPANAYALIKELSEYTKTPVEKDIRQMILAILESWLECPWIFECTQEYLNGLCIKYGFYPTGWRREAS